MKVRFLFILKYYLFWIAVFILQKVVFMAFNYHESLQLDASTWLGVVWHGLRLDLSATAYLMAIPILAISMLSFFDIRFTRSFLNIYNYIFLFLVLFLGFADMELYSYWGFKLDMTPLVYLKTPKTVAASIDVLEVTLIIIFFLILYVAALRIFRKLIIKDLANSSDSSPFFVIPGVFLFALLVIPARGGIGIAPINLGSAYFHKNRFANHSAINVLWNSVYSIVERKSLITSYTFMDDEKANKLYKAFYPAETKSRNLIKKDASVVLIILESFSNRIIGGLGGEPGITPEIDTLCTNSLVFRNFYASGDRSDKGILSLLSGYPAQPTTSIINFPTKTQSLPFMMVPFHDKGYYSAFYYGGDLNFANFRSYFTNSSMDRQVSLPDFPSSLNTQKWGVPDEYLFEKMISDIDTIKVPFFISCFTLSSHEPYDIPVEHAFPGVNRDDMSKSAFYYTDKHLGAFIDKARKSKWWDNTLIIIVADHGSRYPGNTPNDIPEKFHIPMIWTGGALTCSDTSVYSYASQTDLPGTLLNQFEFSAKDYGFSKNILDENSKSFAMYFFNDGFGYMSDSAKIIYDNAGKLFNTNSGIINEDLKESSKAYLQVLSKDFFSR